MDEKYSDLSNVEKAKDYVTVEQTPEGPYGSPIGENEPVSGKSTPWREGQRTYSAFNYEFKSFHQDIPRQDLFAHPVHDDQNKEEQGPYHK